MTLEIDDAWEGDRRGRPQLPKRPYTLHRARPVLDADHPLHITWRTEADVPSLRAPKLAAIVDETFREARARNERTRSSFRVVIHAIHERDLQLLVEAGDKKTLTAELRGLGVWIARRLNLELGRSGRVIMERYTARPLPTRAEVDEVVAYLAQRRAAD
jgi:hypothetical protein